LKALEYSTTHQAYLPSNSCLRLTLADSSAALLVVGAPTSDSEALAHRIDPSPHRLRRTVSRSLWLVASFRSGRASRILRRIHRRCIWGIASFLSPSTP